MDPVVQIELVEATEQDRALLERLAQFYAYDFSEILGDDLLESGRFDSISFGDWPSPTRRCFIVRAGSRPAGFALVRKGSVLTPDAAVTDMEEFFVMRKYRRRGVGRTVVHRLFDMFPGRWEVRELAGNAAAQRFWRRVIAEYTGGAYEEHFVESDTWRGPVQSFAASPRSR